MAFSGLWMIVSLLVIASVGLIVSRKWRVTITLMGVLYIGTFFLLWQHWPITMATAKLVTGWMAIAAIAMTQVEVASAAQEDDSNPQGQLFRLFIAALVTMAMLILAPNLILWLPGIGMPEAVGGALLIGMGLLQIGITSQFLRVILGLLTLLAGFEILYAPIENSILVAGMLSAITLGLALIATYLLKASQEESV